MSLSPRLNPAWTRLHQPALLMSALLLVFPLAAGGQDFSVVSALGDDLTTTPPERGPSYADHIADLLGVGLNDFAQASATTAILLEQGQHTAAVGAGTTFAFLWIGTNDLIFEHEQEINTGDFAFVAESVGNWGVAADALLEAGADVITANLPDLAALPSSLIVADIISLDNLRAATIAFNDALADAADARGIPVADIFALFEEIDASGLTVCGVEIALPPAYGGDTDLFADSIHVSSYGMGLVTNKFIATMNASFGTDLAPLTEAQLGELAGLECEDDGAEPDDGTTPDDDTDGVITPPDGENDNTPADDGTADTDGGAGGGGGGGRRSGGLCGMGMIGAVPGLLLGLALMRPARRRRGVLTTALVALFLAGCTSQANVATGGGAPPGCPLSGDVAAEDGEENGDTTGSADCTPPASAATGDAEENESTTPPPGDPAQSEKERVANPTVPCADLDELVAGNSGFAFDLYHQVRAEENGNIFYSPFSISIALAMTYAGALSETAQEMADTLHFTLDQDQLHPTFNVLDLELASRAESDSDPESEGFTLHVVNRLWGQTGYSFMAEFLDTLAENYGAGLSLLDFRSEPEESRVTINDWVSEETRNRINDLIPPGLITDMTRLVLTNAIYFKAAWLSRFSEDATTDEPFNLLDGSQATVEMMRQTGSFGYAAGNGYQAVQLPYEGNQLSMVILLPDEGNFEAFESDLGAGCVEGLLDRAAERLLDLHLPKFTFEWETELGGALQALGMSQAFDPGVANFLGMISPEALAAAGDQPLYIGAVVHKAFVAVDEEGTEAAAATAVVMRTGSAARREEPKIFTADHPFLFLIRHRPTGLVLFLGRVVEPK